MTNIPRLQVYYAETPATFDTDGRALLDGLSMSPRFIPAHYSYDVEGSRLFDLATAGEAYYLFRCELSIIKSHAHEVASPFGEGDVVELGSGAAKKTALILAAIGKTSNFRQTYYPIDISEEVLLSSSRALLSEFPSFDIVGLAIRYEEGLDWLRTHPGRQRLYLFLGSSLGNMQIHERGGLLRRIRNAMTSNDRLLLGIDLAKDRHVIEAAYNTAGSDAFILNKLVHINHRFEGDLSVASFRHRAVYTPETGQAESRIYSVRNQRFELRRLGFKMTLEKGEYIVAERMFKFSRAGLENELDASGIHIDRWWTDPAGQYAVALCAPA